MAKNLTPARREQAIETATSFVRQFDDAALIDEAAIAPIVAGAIQSATESWHHAEMAALYGATVRRLLTERRNQIPEVKVARRREHIDWKLRGMDEAAMSRLAKFSADFAVNPASAFEWAESAIEAAAQVDCVARMRLVIAHEGPDGGYEAAVNYAVDQALRGARYPQRSTSAVSNLTHLNKTAAWAELAELKVGQ